MSLASSNSATASAFPLAPDRDAMRDALAAQDVPHIHLVAIDPTKTTPIEGRWFGDDVEGAAAWAANRNLAGLNIYRKVNIARPNAGTNPATADMVAVRYFHVEIDPPKGAPAFTDVEIDTIVASALDCPEPPSFARRSGSGVHLQWKSDDELQNFGEVAAINKALIAAFGGDAGTHDVARLLKLEGAVAYPNAAKALAGRPARMCTRIDLGELEGVEHSIEAMRTAFPPTAASEAEHPEPEPFEAPNGDIALLTANDLGLSEFDPVRSVIDHPAGGGNSEDVLACAGALHRAGVSDTEVMGVLLNPANAVSKHIFTQRDRRRAAAKALTRAKKGARTPRGGADDSVALKVSEDAIALTFTAKYRDTMKFDHTAGRWFRWDGERWQKDGTNCAFQYARVIGRQMGAGRAGVAGGAEKFARSDPAHAVEGNQWDADPMLLGTPGGTADLRTGKMRKADPDDKITRLTSCTPSTAAPKRWLQFLDETTGGDAALIRFLQQWCGYSLTGHTREHALMFVYGSGGNGKSVFLNTVARIMAEYAATASMDTFTASKFDQHPTDLAMLHGARLVTASETEEGRAWAEARIKQMTGGDPITARFMRQDFFTYTPAFKLMIVGNHAPVLRNVDEAARRRFNIVPFTLKPAKSDRLLEEKLKAEDGAILAWMIAGCIDWQANGLIRPEIVIAATDDYFNDQDLFGQWLAERCERGANRVSVPTLLFSDWANYARAAGDEPGTMKAMSDRLQRHGFRNAKSNGARLYRGLSLKLESFCDD